MLGARYVTVNSDDLDLERAFVVNAIPQGMKKGDPLAIPAGHLDKGRAVSRYSHLHIGVCRSDFSRAP